MGYLKKNIGFLAVLGTSVALAACGSSNSSSSQSAGNTLPIPVATASPPPSSGTPPYSFSFAVTGAGGVNSNYSTEAGGYIDTDSLLQVTITAGPAAEDELLNGTYTAFTANYGCVTYIVTAYDQTGTRLGASQTTETLAVSQGQDNLCPKAPVSQTLDFSSAVISGSHSGIYFVVQAADYDYWCQYWDIKCPMTAVYDTHTVTGSMSVEVNGSSS